MKGQMGVIKINSVPPGPNARKIVSETKKILSPSIARNYPLVIESAKDCVVKDVDGNEYIDFNSGIAVLNVGSANESVVKSSRNSTRQIHSLFVHGFLLREH